MYSIGTGGRIIDRNVAGRTGRLLARLDGADEDREDHARERLASAVVLDVKLDRSRGGRGAFAFQGDSRSGRLGPNDRICDQSGSTESGEGQGATREQGSYENGAGDELPAEERAGQNHGRPFRDGP